MAVAMSVRAGSPTGLIAGDNSDLSPSMGATIKQSFEGLSSAVSGRGKPLERRA